MTEVPCIIDLGKVHKEGEAEGYKAGIKAMRPRSETAIPTLANQSGGAFQKILRTEDFSGAEAAFKLYDQFKHLPEPERSRAIRDELNSTLRDIRDRRKNIGAQKARLEFLNKVCADHTELLEWANGGLTLQKPAAGGTAALRLALKERRVYDCAVIEDKSVGFEWADELNRDVLRLSEAFLVEHDWASAFAKADDILNAQINLPYEVCCFEFLISGRRVVVIAVQDGEAIHEQYAVEATGGWGLFRAHDLREDATDNLSKLLTGQIVAVCIALDAEVARSEVVRAPHLRNSQADQRKLPLSAHHVVVLSRQSRAAPLPSAGGTHRSPRLHFRRGHWRHFETHKTWIKWMLVGNPDLGFIDKHYRL